MPWSVSKIFAAKVPIKPSEMLFELIWRHGCTLSASPVPLRVRAMGG